MNSVSSLGEVREKKARPFTFTYSNSDGKGFPSFIYINS